MCDVWNTPPRVEYGGNTVVELIDEAAKECRKGKAHFLVVGEALPGKEVVVWWWWPLSAGTPPFLSFKPRALNESVSAKIMPILLCDIPEE